MTDESGGRTWYEKSGLFLMLVAGLWMAVSTPVSCAASPEWAAIYTCTRDFSANAGAIVLGTIGVTIYYLPSYYRPDSLPW